MSPYLELRSSPFISVNAKGVEHDTCLVDPNVGKQYNIPGYISHGVGYFIDKVCYPYRQMYEELTNVV